MSIKCQFEDMTLVTDRTGRILSCSDMKRAKELCMESKHGFFIVGLSSKQFGLYSLEYYYHDYQGRGA